MARAGVGSPLKLAHPLLVYNLLLNIIILLELFVFHVKAMWQTRGKEVNWDVVTRRNKNMVSR